MSIIPKLATSLNRCDEVPNRDLASEIVELNDAAAVSELVENLANKNKGIRNDCIKALYEVGYVEPRLIAKHTAAFLGLLSSKDNRLQWGAMTALGCIVRERPDEIFAAVSKIIAAADKGSVITRDQCVIILINLSGVDRYADKTFPLLLEQMMTCPTNQLPMYAESAIRAVKADKRNRFAKVLFSRLEEIEKVSKRKRVEKVIGRISRSDP